MLTGMSTITSNLGKQGERKGGNIPTDGMTLWMGMAARETLGPMKLIHKHMLFSACGLDLNTGQKRKGNLQRDCKESSSVCSRTQLSAKKYFSG